MDKQNVAYLYNGVLRDVREEWSTIDTFYMNLENIMLNERNLWQKATHFMIHGQFTEIIKKISGFQC